MPYVLPKISELIRDLFDDFQGPITRHLTAGDVPQWDSLGHIQLIVGLERAFNVRFTAAEVRRYVDLGDLIDAVEKKLAG